MLEGLKDGFIKLKRRIAGFGNLSDKEIAKISAQLRITLLEADVSLRIARKFINHIEERLGEVKVSAGFSPYKQALKVIYDELKNFLGYHEKLKFKSTPGKLLIVGLQGTGKTTTCAKLGSLYKAYKPLLVAADVKRPGARKQLQNLAERAGVGFFDSLGDNLKTVKKSLEYAKQNGYGLIIVDSAGRLHVDEELLLELKQIKKEFIPDYTIAVVDGLVGQDALRQAKSFNNEIGLSAGIITKMDGDSKGGVALSFREATGVPILYLGVGEKIDDIERFDPARIASRILGEGDIASMMEEMQKVVDHESQIKIREKMKKGKLNFNDLMKQIEMIEKMGDLRKLIEKLPQMPKGMDFDPDEIKRTKAIIQSMTKEERENPELLNGSRKARIARGSGTTPQDINMMLKQLKLLQKMGKDMLGGGGTSASRRRKKKRKKRR